MQSTGQHRMSKRIAAAHVGMHCACFILLLVYPSMNERRKVTDPRTDISFQCGPCFCLRMLLLNPSNPVNKYCMLTRALLALLPCSYYQVYELLVLLQNSSELSFVKKIEKTVNRGPLTATVLLHTLARPVTRRGGKGPKILN